MLAQHLDNQAALRLVCLILDAYITALDRAFATTSIVRAALEYGLQGLCMKLECQSVCVVLGCQPC